MRTKRIIADMYRMESLEENRNSEIGDLVKKVQATFKNVSDSLAQRLLVDLQDPGNLVAVSYWRDRAGSAKARILNVDVDNALGVFMPVAELSPGKSRDCVFATSLSETRPPSCQPLCLRNSRPSSRAVRGVFQGLALS